MLDECIEGLNIDPEGTYVDATFGGGGHSLEILKRLTTGRLIGFEQDQDAEKNKIHDDRFTMIRQNFRYLKNNLKLFNALPIHGLLADLGISSHQIDRPERGFSTRGDELLDMRMNRSTQKMARDVVNKYPEDDLTKVFREYGEFTNAKSLARLITEARSSRPIEKSRQLKDILKPYAIRGKENQFYARIFQALRIEVNNELEALRELLEQSIEVLAKGGRLVVISYHSLEDRLVKNIIRTGNIEGELKKDFYGNVIKPFEAIHRKVIVPSEQEIKVNNRARSAKLRIAERI